MHLSPEQEEVRLQELKEYQRLTNSPDKELEDLVEIACAICDTPISLLSLVDREHQWFKVNRGLAADFMPREHSFCQHTLHISKEVLVVGIRLMMNASEQILLYLNIHISGFTQELP